MKMAGESASTIVEEMLTIVDSPPPQRQRAQMFASKQIRQILCTNRAKMLASFTNLEEVYWNTSVEDALRLFEAPDCYILVRKCTSLSSDGSEATSDVIFNRLDLFRAALDANSILGPLSCISERAPKLTFLSGDDTLDIVVDKMAESGREDIAIMDHGILRGIITTKVLIIFIRHQLQAAITQSLKPSQIVSLNRSMSIRGPRGTSFGANPIAIAGKVQRLSHVGNGSPLPVEGRRMTQPAALGDATLKNCEDNDSTLLRSLSLRQRSLNLPGSLPNMQNHAFHSSSASDEDISVKTKHESRSQRNLQGRFSESQMVAQFFCISWCCELLIACCVLLDILLEIYDFVNGGDHSDPKPFVATGCLLAVYFFEKLMRSYGFFQDLHHHTLWALSFVIVDASVLEYILVLSGALSMQSQSVVTATRVLRVLRVLLLVRNINVTSRVRRAISSQKTRYRQDGFDLDLTYITKNVIAMSLPALGAEANYRNPMEEVQLFFATKHPNHYMIFNLCKERDYDPELFDGRVERIEVEDHNPPRMNQIISFVERAGEFIQDDEENCIAVHCKGGKGCTGIMVCAWLLYSQFAMTTTDALKWFSEARTGSKASTVQGVSQPSQKRYVEYAEAAFASGGIFSPSIKLCSITVRTCPRMSDDGGWDAWFTIEENGILVFDYRESEHSDMYSKMLKDQDEITLDVGIALQGDVRIIFYDHDDDNDRHALDALAGAAGAAACCTRVVQEGPRMVGDEMCFFLWFHTGFIRSANTTMEKQDVDIACHDSKNRVFQEKFAVILAFDNLPDFSGPSSEVNGRGPFRPILPPSPELLERSRTMRFGTPGPKAAQNNAAPKLSALHALGPSMARLTRLPSVENIRVQSSESSRRPNEGDRSPKRRSFIQVNSPRLGSSEGVSSPRGATSWQRKSGDTTQIEQPVEAGASLLQQDWIQAQPDRRKAAPICAFSSRKRSNPPSQLLVDCTATKSSEAIVEIPDASEVQMLGGYVSPLERLNSELDKLALLREKSSHRITSNIESPTKLSLARDTPPLRWLTLEIEGPPCPSKPSLKNCSAETSQDAVEDDPPAESGSDAEDAGFSGKETEQEANLFAISEDGNLFAISEENNHGNSRRCSGDLKPTPEVNAFAINITTQVEPVSLSASEKTAAASDADTKVVQLRPESSVYLLQPEEEQQVPLSVTSDAKVGLDKVDLDKVIEIAISNEVDVSRELQVQTMEPVVKVGLGPMVAEQEGMDQEGTLGKSEKDERTETVTRPPEHQVVQSNGEAYVGEEEPTVNRDFQGAGLFSGDIAVIPDEGFGTNHQGTSGDIDQRTDTDCVPIENDDAEANESEPGKIRCEMLTKLEKC